MGKFNIKIYVLFFLTTLIVSNSEKIEELLQPKCDGKTIKYSILANITEYLENQKNIDNIEIYEKIEDLKSKRIGIYTPTYHDSDKLKIFDKVIEYENKDNLVADLLNHTMDGGIIFQGIADTIQMISNYLSVYPEPLYSVNLGFGLQKENTNLKTEIDEFIANNKEKLFKDLVLKWDLVNNEAGYIDKDLKGEKTLNVIAKIDSSPYSFLRQFDNELIGAEVEFIYEFAKQYGYQLKFTETNSYDEQFTALKDKTADIALGFFVIKDDKDISFSNILYTGNINLIVRYQHLRESIDWVLYSSVKDFNGEKIGIQAGTFYDDLTKNILPDSEFVTQDLFPNLVKDLLLEETEGFIFDKPIVEYFEKKFEWRITYYDLDDIEPYKNAFAFQKTEEENILLKEFNEFIKTLNIKELFDKWIVADWEITDYDKDKLMLEKDNPDGKVITAAFNFDMKPISYYGQNGPMGVEMDILYKFAHAKNYSIKLIPITLEERTTYIKEKKANITGGSFSITEERKEYMSFSDPLYDCPSVLAVRIDSKIDKIPIEIKNETFGLKPDSNVDVDVKFADEIKTSTCKFPNTYNHSILINCTISDINDVNVSKGFEYVKTTDKISILYNYIEADNFLQANSKIKGHENIITEGDKSQITCSIPSSFNKIWAVLGGLIFALLIFIISKFL